VNVGVVLVALGVGAAFLGRSSSSGSSTADTSPPSTLPRSTLLAPGYTLGDLLVSSGHPDLAAAMVPTEDQVSRLTTIAALLSQLATKMEDYEDNDGAEPEVNSGLRQGALNAAVGGEDDSQHMTGEAVDIQARGWTAYQLAHAIIKAGLPYDQLIAYTPAEGGHVHWSYTTRRKLRRQVAVIDKSGFHTDRDPDKALARWEEDG
jgi:hypothetical protein